jgi:hypothetical protein
MENLSKILGVLALTVLVGCASTGPKLEVEKKVATTIKNIPEWYVQLPVSKDQQDLYVAGTGVSGDLMLAKDKAILDVEKQLANKISAKVSSLVKQYIREVGASNSPLTIEDTEMVTKKMVKEANVAGYIDQDLVVVREGRNFRVYMLAKYPIEANTLRAISQAEDLIDRFDGDRDKAFEELDNDISGKRNDDKITRVIEEQEVIPYNQ